MLKFIIFPYILWCIPEVGLSGSRSCISEVGGALRESEQGPMGRRADSSYEAWQGVT